MRSILLYVSDDGSMEARLEAALGLSRAFDAHLTCLQAVPLEVLVGGDPYGGSYAVMELVEGFHQSEELHRVKLEARLSAERVRWDWLSINEEPAIALRSAQSARTFSTSAKDKPTCP